MSKYKKVIFSEFSRNSLFVKPGLYELNNNNPRKSKLQVRKQVEMIGGCEVEYYSIERFGSKHHLVRSYETEQWNKIVPYLKSIPNNKTLEETIKELLVDGKITFDDIKMAYENYSV